MPAFHPTERNRMIRNLIYHLYPKQHNDMWRWNISQLLRRWTIFNGQRIISIVSDKTTVPAADVKNLFPAGTVFHEFANNKELGEVVAFETLMRGVENIDPRQITLYGHGKGSKYTPPQLKHHKVQAWAGVMYSVLLDYPRLVENSLIDHAIAGAFLKSGNRFGELEQAWHFAGTFFWIKNDRIFNRPDWPHIAKAWWGVESWPGVICKREEAACLLMEGEAPTMQLYRPGYWKESVDSVWHEFQVKYATLRRQQEYSEVLSALKLLGCKRILVTGPQRSGTTFASKALAADLKLPHVEERAFGTHDFQQFHDAAKDKAFVMQCPTMAPYVHLVPGTVVVWMHRDLPDILQSQHRIQWGEFEQLERDRYFSRDSEDAATIKLNAWQRFQRIELGERAFDLRYESLADHPLWIGKDGRKTFRDRQTYPSK